MAKITYPANSPYATTPQTSWHIGQYRHRNIAPHKDDLRLLLTPRYNNRPDLLAYDYYGNPSYWWVFCVRNLNVIRDPVWDFVAGKTIMVPTLDRLKAILG